MNNDIRPIFQKIKKIRYFVLVRWPEFPQPGVWFVRSFIDNQELTRMACAVQQPCSGNISRVVLPAVFVAIGRCGAVRRV
jgi:hypothetical protein